MPRRRVPATASSAEPPAKPPPEPNEPLSAAPAAASGPATSITVGGHQVEPGTRVDFELPLARLFTGTMLSLPVSVLHGRQPGPRLWMNAALHGDELNGLEIIRRILDALDPRHLVGTVVAVPVVNVFGFIQHERYLPDRRDLNRSFPGSINGSLAARLAHLFLEEIVTPCQYGLDYHTGSLHRTNLPQIRAQLDDTETRRIAQAFGAPLIFGAPTVHGSLRWAAGKLAKHMLVYETGEPLRFDAQGIDVGVRGALRVMAALGMWPAPLQPVAPPAEAIATRWQRAGRSGIFYLECELGQRVRKGAVLGRIADPFSRGIRPVKAPFEGMVIGFTNNPLVHQGDALLHLAQLT